MKTKLGVDLSKLPFMVIQFPLFAGDIIPKSSHKVGIILCRCVYISMQVRKYAVAMKHDLSTYPFPASFNKVG